MRSTTLGFERKYNATLSLRERAQFVAFAISDLPEQPGNHTRIKSLNRQGQVPGAILIPRGQLGSRLGELAQERPVAVIYASGNRSQSATALLGQKGFKIIYNVSGRTSAWRRSGLELEY